MSQTPDPFVIKGLAGQPIDLCKVIDAHGHLGEPPNFGLPESSAASLVRVMDRLGIDLSCVSAMPALFGDAARGNRIVETAMREFPQRFFGYMVADVGYPELILPELERCLRSGFGGVKIWSYGAKPGLPYDHPNYRPVLEFANAHHLPVLAHTWGAELDQLAPAIVAFPNITWLMAHTASSQKEKYIRFGKDNPNVYLELCFSPCPRGLVEELVGAGLAGKLIFGSDSTFMSATQQIGRVLFAQVSPQDKEKILGQNAKRALGL
ncbi:MAG TPA: amidohydrolase family protein [Anaerolineae bacterium]